MANRDRRQLPDEVAAYVRQLIISGEVRAGTYLRLEPIAAAVGVSNTPVREGLLRLHGEGFVRLVPRRGFLVLPFTPRDVRDIFWTQASLAGELAARAAELITEEQLHQLARIHRAFEGAAERSDTVRISQAGQSFHVAINRAAESPRLGLLLEAVVTQLPAEFYATIEGKVSTTCEEHPAILDALAGGDATAARRLMEDHIHRGGENLIQMLEHQGIFAAAEPAAAAGIEQSMTQRQGA